MGEGKDYPTYTGRAGVRGLSAGSQVRQRPARQKSPISKTRVGAEASPLAQCGWVGIGHLTSFLQDEVVSGLDLEQ